ncbi:hypothetical protein T310_4934 [Rasamsonia emersonii CBS 393.64]|uniref:N-acetylglucosamine-induced protein 1 n=1 Tax=Rasamsonia emersonii (strain ATCC 16479 / CBS 393.64 / IMI 116815) TaxID=1408163 RepID=A0A0F4YTR3_RASE3|nr:hypothetical protein T310_4934 [Rasamsonia emersonii CBS 393.64]KKA21028.1 hypothetical protein T310_4934 [Rasamsonia emersonii CBS 393.64]
MAHHLGPSTSAATTTINEKKLTDNIDARIDNTSLTPISHPPSHTAHTETESLPYWLVNVPPGERPTTCPEYLRDLSQKNIRILSTPDAAFKRQSWETGSSRRRTGLLTGRITDDLKILYNDWPYGVEKGIVHLVVWTKFELDEDPATGDLTDEMRKQINDFVQKTFCSRVPPEQVVWFKNWKSLKSVHAIEHFHVMLYKPDMEFVKEVTNGDVPLIETI